jgi:hypothetical protein
LHRREGGERRSPKASSRGVSTLSRTNVQRRAVATDSLLFSNAKHGSAPASSRPASTASRYTG